MKRCMLTWVLCVITVVIGLPAAGQDKAAAEKGTSPAGQLQKSLQTWQELKVKCGGNYSYTVAFQSWAGFGHTTEIVIRGNKVVERKYSEFNRNAPPPPPEPGKGPKLPGENWVEKGDQLGSHKKAAPLRTLDELYAEAQKVVETKLAPAQRLYVAFDKQGLLQSCFYVDTRIADDAPRTGVAIGNIRLELAPAKAAEGEVSWEEMKELVRKGNVRTVMQTHSRRVTVLMADGKRYEATEPGIDDIIKFLREIGKDVPIATE